MNSFVNIKTVFSSDTDRTLERLEDVYNKRDDLIETITELTDRWLSREIIEGKTILLKPNWVRHSIKGTDETCLRTHNSFLLAALEVILKRLPANVVIGDAPIQGCCWDKVTPIELTNNIDTLSRKHNIPVHIKDFRRVTFEPAKNNPKTNQNSYEDYMIFDLGKDSYLEPISDPSSNLFRVTCYNPDRLAESHGPGVHKYCITKELFKADIVISLPKIKTHQKTGVTGAIKNLVGLNGDKDYLPHHRIGGTAIGGDCYPGGNYLRHWSELAIDNANRNQGKAIYKFWQKLSSLLWRLSLPGDTHQMAAGWYGNDTTWRMVLDINKIALYGTLDGKIHSTPQRAIYSLCDGIIGGQCDGPLNPEPLPLGIICFSNHSYLTDISMAALMGFDYHKMPLLLAAGEMTDFSEIEFLINGKHSDLKELRKHFIDTIPPRGWAGHIKIK